uniref:Uncharacterized protein n=1 Tax=Nelumbo nucifera TaxID=4432 RepID=A0A822YJ77_NELNU|nr:TPA_asm: hypothetical protein HUJ06_011014 [Nelumbo nucifera]
MSRKVKIEMEFHGGKAWALWKLRLDDLIYLQQYKLSCSISSSLVENTQQWRPMDYCF